MVKDINRVVDLYSDMLLRIACHHVCLEDAKDALQDTYIKYMNYPHDFQDGTHEKAWLIRVITNLCKNNIKYWWHKQRSDIEVEASANQTQIIDDSILDAIRKLPAIQSNIIYFFYYEEMSIKEIAVMLEMSEGTVSSHLHRARKKLKEQLKGEFYYEGKV